MKFIKTIQNSSNKLLNIHQNNLQENIVQHLYSRPAREYGPRPFSAHPLGPAAQQPTGRPLKRPTLSARLGRKRPICPTGRQATAVVWSDRQLSFHFDGTKLKAWPCNPSPFTFSTASQPFGGRLARPWSASEEEQCCAAQQERLRRPPLPYPSLFPFPSLL
jgi:hypothetical protein